MPKLRNTIIAILLIAVLGSLVIFIFPARKTEIEPEPTGQLLKHFDFSGEKVLDEWQEKVFKGHVKYTIESLYKSSCVLAESRGEASALYHKIKVDMKEHPVLSWRWNVLKFPEKEKAEDIKDAKEDDYGARIYVIFPGFLPTGGKALEYVWAENLPIGTVSSSPYSSNIKIFVLQSGYNKKSDWVQERRDLYKDYVAAFGREPSAKIGAIAFMTDSDSTKTSAEAVYDEIKIEYKE